MPIAFNFFKKTLKFPVLWVSLIYLSWWLFTITNDAFSHGLRIMTTYFLITILETLSLISKNKTVSIVLFAGVLCFTLISFGLVLIEGRWLGDAPIYWRHLTYIPLIIVFSGYKAYDLFRNYLSPGKILPILLFVVTLPVLAINVAYPISFFPKVLAKETFGDLKYYIAQQFDVEYRSYTLFYKCEKWSFECNYLPSSSLMYIDKIIIDKDRNEVSSINSNVGLDYTDGNNPRVYEGFSVQLGTHVYQMAINAREFVDCRAHSCDSYTYTLYECNLDYVSCNPLPVQYSETNNDYGWDYLEVNEITNEINSYDRDDKLIFTYGLHPVCYVDSCVILNR